jgi:hypothetical protein
MLQLESLAESLDRGTGPVIARSGVSRVGVTGAGRYRPEIDGLRALAVLSVPAGR